MTRLDVVAAIIRDGTDAGAGRILLSRRHASKHQGGRWEFPGGKVEEGESLHQALARELNEELGIDSHVSAPFMTIDHHYPELSVRLHFRELTDWSGEPHGREQQPVQWFQLDDIAALEFPAANQPIVTALFLPERWLILPSNYQSRWSTVLPRLKSAGVGGVYLRGASAEFGPSSKASLQALVTECQAHGLKALVRDDVALANAIGADGVHLSSSLAATLQQRPDCALVSIACHSRAELDHAEHLRADMVMLSPISVTKTHPHVAPLGWPAFSALATGRPYSVYALGGVGADDVAQARECGGRGIAGISAFWPTENA